MGSGGRIKIGQPEKQSPAAAHQHQKKGVIR